MRQGTRVQLEAVENKEGSWQGERLRLLNVTPGDSKKYLCLGINLILSRSQSVSVNGDLKKENKKSVKIQVNKYRHHFQVCYYEVL